MELESLLARILSLPVDPHSRDLIQELVSKHPQWADQITECWEMHCGLSQCKIEQSGSLPSALGSYEILAEIDRGGMGIVYRARHKELNRIVALKVIRSGELADEHEIARFRREAQIAAKLVHPGIVPIFEVGQCDGRIYYTMAYVDGLPLSDPGAIEPLSIANKVRLVFQITQALEYAHQQGVSHRDIKPSNILIDSRGDPILIDFGLAKFDYGDSDLTHSGATVGTPTYMAPEQLELNRQIDFRIADVYSLGAVLYYLLVGRPPFVGPTSFDVMIQLKDRQPVSPSRLNRKVDRELDTICHRAMEKTSTDRYRSAAEFGRDLASWLAGAAISSPTKSPMAHWIRWWKQEPGLVTHVLSILLVLAIVLVSHLMGYSNSDLLVQSCLLSIWLVVCFPLQRWVFRKVDPTLPAVSWGLVDLTFVSWLIANADPPRSLLLVAYPLMVTASALFYRTRFVALMTIGSIVAFWALSESIEDPSLLRNDFRVLFTGVLLVQCLTLTSLIHRVRNLFTYREHF